MPDYIVKGIDRATGEPIEAVITSTDQDEAVKAVNFVVEKVLEKADEVPDEVSAPAIFVGLMAAKVIAVILVLIGIGSLLDGGRTYYGYMLEPNNYTYRQVDRAANRLMIGIFLVVVSLIGFYIAEFASGSRWARSVWQWVKPAGSRR